MWMSAATMNPPAATPLPTVSRVCQIERAAAPAGRRVAASQMPKTTKNGADAASTNAAIISRTSCES